jgi:hypothetical protein
LVLPRTDKTEEARETRARPRKVRETNKKMGMGSDLKGQDLGRGLEGRPGVVIGKLERASSGGE